MEPAVYNRARLTENQMLSEEALPIAEANSAELLDQSRGNGSQKNAEEYGSTKNELENIDNVLNETDEGQDEQNHDETELANMESASNVSNGSLNLQNLNENESSDEENTTNGNASILHEGDSDEKHPLGIVQLDAIEAAAFDDLFDESTQENSTTDQPLSLGSETIFYSPGGTKRATKIIDEDCEFTYELGIDDIFKPVRMGYQVKLNDLLSENIPFQENVSK